MDQQMQQTLLERGQALARSENPQDNAQAATYFNQVLAANPTHLDALIGQAQLQASQQWWDAAYTTARQILQLAPNNPKALRILALYYWEKRNFDLALSELEKVIQLERNDSTLWMLKGGILRNKYAFDQKSTYLDQAIAAFDYALQLDPGDRDAIAARSETIAVKHRASGYNSFFWTKVWLGGWVIFIVGAILAALIPNSAAQVLLAIIVAIPLFVGWIMTMVRSVQEKRWVFFILVLLIGNSVVPIFMILWVTGKLGQSMQPQRRS